MSGLELKVPPPLVSTVALILMWLTARLSPWASFTLPGRLPIAAAFVVVGLAVAVAGIVAFRRARTTINPTRPERSSQLVTGGIYRFSRNPMYLGIVLALVGAATYLSNAMALAPLVLLIAYLTRFQIIPEERWMRSKFGDDFARYSARVRRWI